MKRWNRFLDLFIFFILFSFFFRLLFIYLFIANFLLQSFIGRNQHSSGRNSAFGNICLDFRVENLVEYLMMVDVQQQIH